MRQGAPSNAEQVDAEAWTAMREAAREAGVPLNEWLRTTLLGAAYRDSPQPPAAAATPARAGGTSSSSGMVGDLQRKVQDLAGEIDRLASSEPPPPHRGSRAVSARGDDLITALDALNGRIGKLLQDPDKGTAAAATHLDDTIRRLNDRLDALTVEKRAEQRPADTFDRRVSDIARTVEALNKKLERVAAPEAARTPAPQPAAAKAPEPRHSPIAPPPLDAVVAEIAARQRSLDLAAASARPQPGPAAAPEARAAAPFVSPPAMASASVAPPPPAAERIREPSLDFSGLERQLNIISDQMQELRRAAPMGETVTALRRDLDEMKRSLGELAPRSAVTELERAISLLTERLSQDDGVNGEIVRGLAELRDTMRELTPPESPAVLVDKVETLSRKLDVVSAKTVDGATIARLQAQTGEIRELLGRALSNDAVRMLAEQVGLLVERINQVADPEPMVREVVAALENRLDALGDRLVATLRQPADPAPANDILRRLGELQVAVTDAADAAPKGMEAMFDGLVERIARIMPRGVGDGSIEALSRQVAGIAEKIEATDSRFTQLAGIERALGDLFVQIEETRASAISAAEERARAAAAEFAGTGAPGEGVASITRGLADLEARQDTTERRTYDTLEAVNETLGRMVERIASLEALGQAPTPAEDDAARAYHAPFEPAPGFELIDEPEAEAPAAPAISAADRPVPQEPELPDDFPLEPGSGSPMRGSRLDSPLADDGAPPIETEDEAQVPSRTAFIAAARRAAQGTAKPETSEASAKGKGSRLKRLLSPRSRVTLLVGVCGAALALGSWQIAGSMRDGQLARMLGGTAKPAATPASETTKAPGNSSISPTPSPSMAGPVPNVPSSGVVGAEQPLAPGMSASGDPSGSAADITGSIGAPAGTAATPAPAPISAPGSSSSSSTTPPADLPASVGGPALRSAAVAGDPAAAYEVGARLAEGRGPSQSPALAARWFEFAMAKGSIPAMYRLAALLENGADGLPRNVERARQLYERAAEAGNIRAMHNLAVLLAEGVDGQPDYRAASGWFRKAAERGLRDSQYNLGVLYARGLGVSADLAESWKWFALAASQGDGDAARKRDEIAARLDQKALVAIRFAVQTWMPVVSDDRANVALANPDWDRPDAPAAKKKAGAKT